MRSVMKHTFSEVPRANIPRSSFNRSHGVKTTFDADYLIPVLVDDVVPGDTFNVNMNFFARLATPLYPIMDNMYLESFFFFVPYRLVWDNWEKMHGAQDDPADSISFTVPTVASVSITTGSIGDYFGLPLGTIANDEISALPFRAYNLIWNEWFRDQNLQDSVLHDTDDSGAGLANYGLLKRGKRHDYFTSCLPWPQKGDAVQFSLGSSADVITQATEHTTTGLPVLTMRTPAGALPSAGGIGVDGVGDVHKITTGTISASDDLSPTNLYADLSTATSGTINDLRLAFQTQRLLERDARSGTRYNELILAHFGVTVPDFRVQRPEFLGGGSSPINITPVAQTSGQPTPAADDKLGNLAGFGTVAGSHGFTKSFVEHGVVIGLVNVRADITYSQGIERYWSKSTRYDFYYPVLAQIGEQSVLNKEIYHNNDANDDLVFGYQERYAEYRYKPSRLTALMKPEATSSLEAWHLSEEFTSLPTLGNTFIQSNTGSPLDRAIAIPSEPHFIFDAYFDMQCARPMPLFGVPGNLDHF
jgi:hypothetical protein